ncbi:MAG: sulfotransferase [Planctomycetaceae bacterium]|nr:sulfotransferase [Planctomycetaceae bacterium]
MAANKSWSFEKPYRTYGMRIYNGLGEFCRTRGLRKPLEPRQLMRAAEREAKLSDWGDESFVEALGHLVQSFEEEARITSFGRLVLRKQLVQSLCNRLRIEKYRKEFANSLPPVTRPVFVVGLPRTGTTLMFNLLAQDQRRRPLMTHESLFPMGSCVFGIPNDGRMRAKLVTGIADVVAPGLRAVHPFKPDTPEECTWLLANTFISPYFLLMGHLPSYMNWIDLRTREQMGEVYAYHRLQLQLLQKRFPKLADQWVLKSPVHQFGLESLLDTYEDACVIQMNRDPKQTIPSACSLFAVVRGVYSDSIDLKQLGPDVLSTLARPQQRADRVPVSDRRVLQIDYQHLVDNPIETVTGIYHHFEIPLPQDMVERMKKWLSDNPQNKHGKHKYSLEQFGLSPESLVAAFPEKPPIERVGVAS